jgi:hypothetical protein
MLYNKTKRTQVDNTKNMDGVSMVIDASDFDKVLKYWKPEEGKEYHLVVFTDWKIKPGNFGDELQLSVINVDGEVFGRDKLFNTKSSSFVTQIKPIILNAQSQNVSVIAVALVLANRKFKIFDRTEEVMQPVRNAFAGVHLGPSA